MVKAAKIRTAFVCQQCGHSEPKWVGRCPQCLEWSSFVEEIRAPRASKSAAVQAATDSRPVPISQAVQLPADARLESGLGEIDRVLGGGLVPGSVVLLGGEPGIGKSTLLCQLLAGIGSQGEDRKLLYASGEESVAQTALRARRIGAASDSIIVVAETQLERILVHAANIGPSVLAIDSIQTTHSSQLDSIPGSVGQVRESAARLLEFAKTSGTSTILVGHVTKGGHLAGPKTLEHVVDVVLQFDGEGGSPYRILRATKNRFGSTQEIGVFEMRGSGLSEVQNPSELFLAERPKDAPGSVVVASAEGTRPILVEVQALVAPASAGVGRRTASGVDSNRLALLLAVLAQRASYDVIANDVFVNLAGGLKLSEPAIDLGVALAIASSARELPIDPRLAVFGEVGLSGEVRAIHMADIRLAEAARLGFKRCILPKHNFARLEKPVDMDLIPITTVSEALEAALPR